MDAFQKFRSSPNQKAWMDISASDTFDAAATAAMMMMTDENKIIDHDDAAKFGHQITGAKKFLKNLQQLGEPSPKQREPIASASLDHNA